MTPVSIPNPVPHAWRISLASALVLLFGLLWVAAPAHAQNDVQADIDALIRASKARAAIVKQVKDAVVHISVEKKVTAEGEQRMPDLFDDEFFRRFFQPRMPPREFRQRGMGTGVIVSEDGYIISNNHVVGGADQVVVKLTDGRELQAEIVGTDPATDLAVIRVQAQDLPAAKLGNSDELEIGESVIAIGNPFGLEQTITAGIVSAKGRSGVGVTDYEDFIQTDASINPGNSGGPLINLSGEVVGINTAIFSRSGGNMGIGFAIPINMSRHVMNALIESGKVTRGFLGVVIQDVTQDLADALGVEPGGGVLISNVGPGTPAQAAGIEQGDVITRFNGQPVRSSNQLRNRVAAVAPGETVPVELLRDGERMELEVTIAEQPADMRTAFQQGGGPAAPQAFLGMNVEPLNPASAEQFGYQGLDGLLVTGVEPDSPAANAGLRQGALILEANRQPMRTVEDLRQAIEAAPSGSNLLLLVRLGEISRFLVIKVP